MASDTTRPEVIDADGHVVEPDTVWKEYAEPAYRDRLDRPGGGVQELGMQHAYPEATLARRIAGRVRRVVGRRRGRRQLGRGIADEDGPAGRVRPARAPRRHGRRRHRRRGALPHVDAHLGGGRGSVRRRVSRLQQLAARLLLGGAEPSLRRRRRAAPGHRRRDRSRCGVASSSSTSRRSCSGRRRTAATRS